PDGSAHGRTVGELHAALAEEWSRSRRYGRGGCNNAVDFAGRRGLRFTPVTPHRSGIDEESAAEAAVFGQEIQRILEFEARAPKHRAADIVVGRARSDVARPYAGRLEPAHQVRTHLEVIEHAHIVVAIAGVGRGAILEAENVAGLQVDQANEVGDNLVIGAY